MRAETPGLLKEAPRAILSDVKLARPGMLKEVLRPEEIPSTPQFKNLIIFGSGPIMDRDSKMKAEDEKTPVGQEDVNMWGKMSARAAAELKLAGIVDKITFSGGTTGGVEYGSEASIMKDLIRAEYPMIDPDDILEEPMATNTLENFAYVLNKFDEASPFDPNPETTEPVALLGADFHVARIKDLANLYGVNNTTGFSAQAVLRLIAERTNDRQALDHLDKLADLSADLTTQDSRVNWREFNKMSPEENRAQESKSAVSAAHNTFFEEQQGTERSPGILQRWREENRWGGGLKHIPEYWVGYLGFLTNDARLTVALDRIPQEEIVRMGVDRSRPLDEVRSKLLEYTKPEKRIIPSADWEKNPPASK